MESAGGPDALRRRRRERGLTQSELAARAGVSRQLVAAVESGRNVPAVDAALRIAQALGTSVEAVFSFAGAEAVEPALDGSLREGMLVRCGRVGERLVATELADHGVAGAAWASADGVYEGGVLRMFGGSAPAGLVVAGCDPALGIAETMLGESGARRLLAISAATDTALRSLGRGRVHAAVVHGPESSLPVAPLPVLRLHLARWQVGVGVAPGTGRLSLAAVLEGAVPLVQRDGAAASQQALERAAARAHVGALPPGPRAAGHLDAARQASTLGCAGVTTEAAARAFGLRFLPLEGHTVEVWLAERWRAHPSVEAFANLLAAGAFTERVARRGGYDLAGCGAVVA